MLLCSSAYGFDHQIEPRGRSRGLLLQGRLASTTPLRPRFDRVGLLAFSLIACKPSQASTSLPRPARSGSLRAMPRPPRAAPDQQTVGLSHHQSRSKPRMASSSIETAALDVSLSVSYLLSHVAPALAENNYHRPSKIVDSPSTSLTVHDYFLDNTCTTTYMMSSTTSNIYGACTSTVAEDPCTTTLTTVAGTTTSTTSTMTHVQLHHYDLIRCEYACLEGITNETTTRGLNVLVYERRCYLCRRCHASCTLSLFCHVPNKWEPSNRDHPIIFGMTRTCS